MISGSNSVRLFYVATNITFGLTNLTLAGGSATDGAAICNHGGTAYLCGVSLSNNRSLYAGGAIRNVSGTVKATNCWFLTNVVGSPDSAAWGGAICSESGTLALQNCVFRGNLARAGASTNSASGTSGPEASLDSGTR